MPPWQSLTFEQVCFRYPSRGEETSFAVGPIDLEIKKGEVTFIIGGNGSGKSTMSKLLTHHYRPDDGKICFGGNEVNDDTIASYRQQIFAIYSNYYLFDRLLTDVTEKTEAIAKKYLHELRLDKKVTLKDGMFSTTLLSDGQRKRLALLVAFLEEKELYLFDEWAADQDPEFKDIFYTKILPDLKAMGKAVVVISHDDRYFGLADSILVMAEGKLRSSSVQTATRVAQGGGASVKDSIGATTDDKNKEVQL